MSTVQHSSALTNNEQLDETPGEERVQVRADSQAAA